VNLIEAANMDDDDEFKQFQSSCAVISFASLKKKASEKWESCINVTPSTKWRKRDFSYYSLRTVSSSSWLFQGSTSAFVCVCVFSCWCTNTRTNDKERALSSSYLTNNPSRAGCDAVPRLAAYIENVLFFSYPYAYDVVSVYRITNPKSQSQNMRGLILFPFAFLSHF